jgi:hypothetical protein
MHKNERQYCLGSEQEIREMFERKSYKPESADKSIPD